MFCIKISRGVLSQSPTRKKKTQPQPKHPTKRKQKRVRWRTVDNKRLRPQSWLFTGHVKRAAAQGAAGGAHPPTQPPRAHPGDTRSLTGNLLFHLCETPTLGRGGGSRQLHGIFTAKRIYWGGGKGGWTTTCRDTARCEGAISSRAAPKRPPQATNPRLGGAAPQRRPGPPGPPNLPSAGGRCPLAPPLPPLRSPQVTGEEGGGENTGQAAVPLNSILWFTSPPSRCNN